jgi:hypothetical protein
VTYSGLLFSYRETLQEIERANQYFQKYLEPESFGALDEWLQKLRAFRQRSRKGDRMSWEIQLDRPIRTVVSRGQYQFDNLGGLNVRGSISAVWAIEHAGRHGSLPRNDEAFRLVDLGSTLVKVLRVPDAGDEVCVAAWHFDVGVANSPGHHFHTQISTRPDAPNEAAEIYFPKALDMPRFPSVLFYPLDALEFLLGELFLADWPKYAVGQNARVGFSDFQTTRLKNVVKGWGFAPDKTLPLLALRTHKPAEDAFLT